MNMNEMSLNLIRIPSNFEEMAVKLYEIWSKPIEFDTIFRGKKINFQEIQRNSKKIVNVSAF